MIWDDIPEIIPFLFSNICYADKFTKALKCFFLSLFTFKHNLREAVLLHMKTVTNLLTMSNLKMSTNTHLYAGHQFVPNIENNKALNNILKCILDVFACKR